MKNEIVTAIQRVDTSGWNRAALEFGDGCLEISVPPECVTLSMKDVPVLENPGRAIEEALARPIGSPAIETIITGEKKEPSSITVAVAVSDITRPVPYKGEGGILIPLLKKLEGAGIRRRNITIVVGTGTHRPSTPAEKVEMFGGQAVHDIRIVDHDCESSECLTYLGKTEKQTEVYVNAAFYSADVRIVTGLVESHFMAGVSGGRKGVCPALVDKRTIEKFHGPKFLESPCADNLILAGNPCHEEALDVARTIGVDFTVNVTLDKNMRLTGVFAGDLEEAHSQAFKFMRGYTAIPLDWEFDIVLTHGGYVGRNHYQTAKAACAAVPAVKTGGTIIIAADNRDSEPIGSLAYKDLIRELKMRGADGYVDMIRDPGWTFALDQWEPEVWGRVLRKVGEKGLIYCSPQIPPAEFTRLPGLSGYDFLEEAEGLAGREAAQAMVQNALLYAISKHLKEGPHPATALIREGPYAVPCLQKAS